MKEEINESTTLKLSIKTLGGIAVSIQNTEKVVDEIKLQLIRMEDKMDKKR